MSGRPITEIGPWEAWSTDRSMGLGVTWSLRPKGAKVAVITDLNHLDDIEHAISEYESDIDTHILDARRKLDSYPEDWEGERAVQEALISALADVVRVRAMESVTNPKKEATQEPRDWLSLSPGRYWDT